MGPTRLLLAVAPLTVACAVESVPAEVATVTAPIVFGEDDRVELYQAEEPFVALGRELAIALMAPERLRPVEEGAYAVEAPSLGTLQSLCAGERFADQTAAASCSGVLVAPGVVATAGHCLGVDAGGQPDCKNNVYVRGYAVLDPAAPVTVAEEEVYGCDEVLALAQSAADSACHVDLALVGLERTLPVEELPVLRDAPVEADEPVTVIGYPAGLPVKVDGGARVVDPRLSRGDSFTLSSDTFAVSSGAGVFDRTGALVGVFARGRRDYDADGDCQRVHRETEYEATGYEEAAQIAVVRQLLTAVEQRERRETFELFPGSSICSVTATVRPEAASGDGSSATVATNGCTLGAPSPGRFGGPLPLLVLVALSCVGPRQRRGGGRRRAAVVEERAPDRAQYGSAPVVRASGGALRAIVHPAVPSRLRQGPAPPRPPPAPRTVRDEPITSGGGSAAASGVRSCRGAGGDAVALLGRRARGLGARPPRALRYPPGAGEGPAA